MIEFKDIVFHFYLKVILHVCYYKLRFSCIKERDLSYSGSEYTHHWQINTKFILICLRWWII